MSSFLPRMPLCLLSLVSLLAVQAAQAQPVQTYTVDFFPELPQTNHTLQLRILGPTRGTVIQTRLHVGFTPSAGFNAAELQMVLVAPVPTSPSFGGIFITGEDLGWSGQGTFAAELATEDLNGALRQGLWGFELQSINDPPAYSGQFTADSRWEVDILPPCIADFNGDSAVSVQDIFDFLTAYFEQSGQTGANLSADIDLSGDVGVQDIFDFLTGYFAGCD